ncbi:hypothetical protein DFJ77DRAFT_102344 [Powellomyces hirtus]|nr:hypothetical protein DFJ77DRAFT_102344 [Powellomyces hirtus]
MRSAHRAKAKKPRAQDSEESFDFPTSYDGFDSQEGPVNASVGEPSRSVSEKGRATVQLVADGRQGSSVSADRNVTKSLVPSLSVVTPASIAETDTPTPVTALASMMEQLALRSAVEQPPFSPLADSVGINVNQRPVVPPILEHPEAPETAKINAQVSVASPVKDRPLPRIPISIPCSSSQLPWYNDASEHLRLDHSQATASGLWRYPSTEQETLQYKVYCALWAKGYYITSGSKFGGDYLLYPGDILRYHSHYVASVVPMEKLHSPLDAVMFGRLGTAVKKSHAVCSWDVVKDEFVCYCIQWTGWN